MFQSPLKRIVDHDIHNIYSITIVQIWVNIVYEDLNIFYDLCIVTSYFINLHAMCFHSVVFIFYVPFLYKPPHHMFPFYDKCTLFLSYASILWYVYSMSVLCFHSMVCVLYVCPMFPFYAMCTLSLSYASTLCYVYSMSVLCFHSMLCVPYLCPMLSLYDKCTLYVLSIYLCFVNLPILYILLLSST